MLYAVLQFATAVLCDLVDSYQHREGIYHHFIHVIQGNVTKLFPLRPFSTYARTRDDTSRFLSGGELLQRKYKDKSPVSTTRQRII
jgi:hypothetical protein